MPRFDCLGVSLHVFVFSVNDIIGEVVDAGVAVIEDNKLALGPEFKLATALPLPSGMGATIYAKDEREQINLAKQREFNIRTFVLQLAEPRSGIRFNKDNIDLLAESMRAFNFMPEFPILMDKNGRILSGRHRYEAAKLANVEPLIKQLDIDSDAEAAKITIVSNLQKGFTKAELEHIRKDLGAKDTSLKAFVETLNTNERATQPSPPAMVSINNNDRYASAIGRIKQIISEDQLDQIRIIQLLQYEYPTPF